MTSLLTNASAITALQNLNMTSRSLQMTQDRISTGMRVSKASDNAAYWSIATSMRSDSSALSAVKDALGLGSATIDVANSGLTKTVEIITQIKSKLTTARTPSVDRVKIQSEITQLQNQLKSVADSSVFYGENWLSVDSSAANYSATKSIVASFSRASGSIVIGTIDVDVAGTRLYDANGQLGIIDKTRTKGTAPAPVTTDAIGTLNISTLTDSAADITKLDAFIQMSDDALTEVTTAATKLGSIKTRVSSQQDFIGILIDSLTKGVGQLVDADMNEESTKLQALQVQQQLGVQALSIANQNSQQIMSLFKGG